MSHLSTLLVLLPLITVVWAGGGAIFDNCTELQGTIALLPMADEETVFVADQLQRMPNSSFVLKWYSRLFDHWVKVKKVFVRLDQRGDTKRLSNEVYNQLHGVDIIIGPYYPVIEGYARMMKIAYILTKPPPLRIERRMKKETKDERVLFSIWPSWEDFFIDSVEAMLDSREGRAEWGIRSIGRVLIIREGLSEESLEIANLLQNTLINLGRTTRIKMVTLTEKDEENAWDVLYKVIVPIRPHIIVYLYDRTDDLNLLFQLYKTIIVEHHAGPDLLLAEWFFWDMTSPYSGLMRKLLSGDGYQMARKLKLRNVVLEPCLEIEGFSCDTVKEESTELVGYAESIEYSMLMLCKYEINYTVKEIFLSILRMTDLEDATNYDYCYTHFSSGLAFQDGFRIFSGIHVGTLRPKKVVGKDGKSHTYLNCASRLELHWTRFYDKKTKKVTHKKVAFKHKPSLTTHRAPDAPASIIVVREEPFAFQDKYSEEYQGLCVEIIEKAFEIMSARLGRLVQYHLYDTEGNQYGALNKKNKTWNGAMGELQVGRADVAIGMISKTKDRKHFFDFTPAFEYVGLTYMAAKEEHPGSMFGFLKPFDTDLWWGIFIVFLLAALFIRVLDYWNPYADIVEAENRFDVNESLWYSFGAMSGAGGGDFAPYMYPTRVFTVFYWFFALIITASYTGNLASFLTEKYEILPTAKMADLPFKHDMTWGTLPGSFMESYIQSMPGSYQSLAKGMVHVGNYSAGKDKVLDGKFAFIGNSLLLKNYESKDPSCSIAVAPDAEAYTELAFPISRRWPNRREFINAFVRMRADGTIADILKRWLRYETECVNPDEEDEEEHTSLDLKNFYGLYVVLAASIAISFIVLFLKLAILKCKQLNRKRRGGHSNDPDDKEAPLASADSDDKETDV